jgi:hypothetical protein
MWRNPSEIPAVSLQHLLRETIAYYKNSVGHLKMENNLPLFLRAPHLMKMLMNIEFSIFMTTSAVVLSNA